MAYGFSYDPTLTTSAAGTFNVDSTGYIQGESMDSPAIRNQLAGGVVARANQIAAFPAGSPTPMWGGMAITTDIPTGYLSGQASGPKAMGAICMPATSVSTGTLPISAFTVFDQAHHMVATPSSQVPLATQGMSVHFYRLGTGARIPVQCDPALISLQGGLETQQVSWDFVNQRLIAYSAGAGAVPVRVLEIAPTNCMIVNVDPVTGFATWNRNGACALILI